MELVIKDKSKSQLRSCFKIEVGFMFGDADGEETIEFIFTTDQYKDPEFRTLTHDFIKSIQDCIRLDSRGRGGFDSSDEAIRWYALGENSYYVKKGYKPVYQWGRFCEDIDNVYNEELAEQLNSCFPIYEEYNFFSYSIPTYADGWYGSYDYINVWYYDAEGYKYSVEIKNV